MSTHEITYYEEDGSQRRLRNVQPTTFQRFRDARHHIQQRNEREITNDEVIDLLLDAWWHLEREHARGSS